MYRCLTLLLVGFVIATSVALKQKYKQNYIDKNDHRNIDEAFMSGDENERKGEIVLFDH